MCSEIAIKVECLSKCYNIYAKPNDRLKQMIMPRLQQLVALPAKMYYSEFWALKDVSFDVKKGETVGIIGRNGSGKSTLLQMICGTLTPTSGYVQTNGRIAALLELGSGFNPEFTGRENVYLNGAILGLSKEEIDTRYNDIVAFADIGDFIEQPIKTYSSGMVVRLAFSVNIMSGPEIMVVDEALAVGDMMFQAKCMTALKRLQDKGATVLFVSHDISSIKSLCSQAVYLEKGTLKNFGKAATIADEYIRTVREEMNTQKGQASKPSSEGALSKIFNSLPQSDSPEVFKISSEFEQRVNLFRYGLGGARIKYAELVDMEDQPIISAEFNQQVKIKIYLDAQDEIDISVNYYIQDDKKNLILGAGLRLVGETLLHCAPNSQYIITYTTLLPLQEGNYSIELQLTKPVVLDQTVEYVDVIDNGILFQMQRRNPSRLWSKVYVENSVDIKRL